MDAATIARLRELLLAEATVRPGPATAFAFVTREEAALLAAVRSALPALLDRLEAAEAVVEAARAYRERDARLPEAPAHALDTALRRYDEARR